LTALNIEIDGIQSFQTLFVLKKQKQKKCMVFIIICCLWGQKMLVLCVCTLAFKTF